MNEMLQGFKTTFFFEKSVISGKKNILLGRTTILIALDNVSSSIFASAQSTAKIQFI